MQQAYTVVCCVFVCLPQHMRIRNRRAAARHIYIYNIITLSLFFSAQQLNDNFETILCKQKNQEKRPTLIPRCVVYRYYATYTPSQVHELLIKFVWLCCCCFSYMYIFFKSIFFFLRFVDDYYMKQNSRRVLYAGIEFSAL